MIMPGYRTIGNFLTASSLWACNGVYICLQLVSKSGVARHVPSAQMRESGDLVYTR